MSHSANLYIISGPSGCGKSSLVSSVIDQVPDIARSISYTTRLKRPEENDGVHYHFVNDKIFQEMIQQKKFVEYAQVYQHYYATDMQWIENKLSKNIEILLEIDWQGAYQIKTK